MSRLRILMRVSRIALLGSLLLGCTSMPLTVARDGSASISVIYLGPAWGPNEKGEEVVYFLKQVTLQTAQDEQYRIYLCSIKPDGTERKEIVQLWKDQPDQFIEPRPVSVHMEINVATKRAAIGVEKGNRTGIFVVNLDGTGFQKVWPKEWETNRPTNASYPTWSPDGQWLAFEEWRFEKGYDFRQIVKCRPDGSGYTRLTERDSYKINIQPAWSPTTNLIAYVHYPNYYPGGRYLWLMNDDGSSKRETKAWGDYPRWSPDGKQILHSGTWVVDASTGRKIRDWIPAGIYPKWGAAGFVSGGPMDISVAGPEGKSAEHLLNNISRAGNTSDIDQEGYRW